MGEISSPADETAPDATSWIDRDRIPDGVLQYYDVAPSACSGSLLSATKTATPYPVFESGGSLVNLPTYAITVRNDGREGPARSPSTTTSPRG